MSITLSLKPRVLRSYDPDASSYISSVETADNQTLEQPIKEAITEFVVGCKIRGIWESIKSCCLLCGARTLDGAIVPLKGNAPILTSFVGDYNRETGLKRTSGSFNINRNNNADPQNNKHVAIYPTFIDYGSSDSNFRSLLSGSTSSGSTYFAVTSLGLNARVNTTSNIVTNQPIIAGNLIAVSVLNSGQSQLLYNNNINTMNVTTTTPVATDLTLFGGGGVSTSLSRISYYSVGERLDLRLLKQVVDTFNSRILQTFRYIMTDNDASSYVSRVEAADQTYLPNHIRLAVDNFVIGCKSDNIWSSIRASCILMGATTINGALVPLIGQKPGNVNFNNSDYNRKTGLKGNNATKYLISQRSNNEDPQNNQHLSVYISESSSLLNSYIGAGGSSNGASNIGKSSANSGQPFVRSRNASGLIVGTAITTGFMGKSRSLSNSIIFRHPIDGNTTHNYPSQAPSADMIYVFARNSGTNVAETVSDARLSFYSIGESLDLSLLDSRVSSLASSISSAL